MQAGNKRSYNMKRNGIRSLILAIGISAGLVATTATGGILPITLQDGNTTVTIDPNNPADGVNSWTVNGVNQLLQQWFWYRIGNTGPAYSIDTLGALVTARTALWRYGELLQLDQRPECRSGLYLDRVSDRQWAVRSR